MERAGMSEKITIFDPQGADVGVADVSNEDGLFTGTVDLSAMPAAMLNKFAEYENIVNNQMFSFLDRIEEEIASLGLRARLGGAEVELDDVQMYPTDCTISFRTKNRPVSTTSIGTSVPAVFPPLDATPKTSN
jgi:hypothetical protein